MPTTPARVRMPEGSSEEGYDTVVALMQEILVLLAADPPEVGKAGRLALHMFQCVGEAADAADPDDQAHFRPPLEERNHFPSVRRYG